MNYESLKQLALKATPGPRAFNGYSLIVSVERMRGYDEWADPLIDANHTLGLRGDCFACQQLKCVHAEENYDRDPAVAYVPAHHGDTAVRQKLDDARFIEACDRDTILSMLSEIEQAHERIRQLEGEAAALRNVLQFVEVREPANGYPGKYLACQLMLANWEQRRDSALSGSAGVEVLKEVERLREALEFYADTYLAIGFFPDAPCGDFIDDFEETDEGYKPGKKARAALSE